MARTPCCNKNGLKKGPWTPQEDQKLIHYIQKHGYGNWRTLPKNAELQRCGKSCRLRWTNYLRPDIKRGKFSFEEEETIIQLHGILGNKWSAIATRLPGRTDNEIKNYWNTHIRKRLLKMGIDPITHNPRLHLIDFSSFLNSTVFQNSCPLWSRLLAMQQQSLINPELLKLATSLFSSNQFIQECNNNVQENQCFNNQTSPHQEMLQFYGHGYGQQVQFPNVVEELPTNYENLSAQNCQMDDSYVPVQQGSCDQFVGDVSNNNSLEATTTTTATTTMFQSNNSTNLSYQSVLSNLSTPSSSTPAPLSSAYNVNYCNSKLKFEIDYIWDEL